MKVVVALLCLAPLCASAAETTTLFDADPAHVWNRLYVALHAKAPFTGSQLSSIPEESFPADTAYARLLAVLDEFLEFHAEKQVAPPVKRAILQSAVWATFDQASDPLAKNPERRLEISRRCAEIVRRLALTDAEIAGLPDNYGAVVKRKTFAADYDAADREAAFVPPALLDPDGPWVILGGDPVPALGGRVWEPAARQHLRATQGRAVFYVLIRLPGDRAGTLQYLRALANFPRPYVLNERYAESPSANSPVKLNPEVPQLPPGTQVALLRKMLLPNASGELRVTPLTESLQIRVYAKDPKLAQWGDADNQVFYQFRLDADGLFDGKDGLARVAAGDREIPLAFERPSLFGGNACGGCHAEVGVASLLTYRREFSSRPNTPWFEPSKAARQDEATMNWKQRDFSWGLLRGMLASAPGVAQSK